MTNQGLKTTPWRAEQRGGKKPSHWWRHWASIPSLSWKPIVLSFIFTVSVWATITKYHRLSDFNNRNLFLTVLKARSPRSRFQLIRFLVRALVLVLRWPPSCCILTGPFHHSCTLLFLYRLSPVELRPHPLSSLNFNYLLKALSLNIVTLGIRASTYEVQGDTIQSMAANNSFYVRFHLKFYLFKTRSI